MNIIFRHNLDEDVYCLSSCWSNILPITNLDNKKHVSLSQLCPPFVFSCSTGNEMWDMNKVRMSLKWYLRVSFLNSKPFTVRKIVTEQFVVDVVSGRDECQSNCCLCDSQFRIRVENKTTVWLWWEHWWDKSNRLASSYYIILLITQTKPLLFIKYCHLSY